MELFVPKNHRTFALFQGPGWKTWRQSRSWNETIQIQVTVSNVVIVPLEWFSSDPMMVTQSVFRVTEHIHSDVAANHEHVQRIFVRG